MKMQKFVIVLFEQQTKNLLHILIELFNHVILKRLLQELHLS